ncbi:MFS transporter, partial [Candidatus Bathyarchaeota archaeon]|nr:MFS transporter [Candidatus Bathyarchaeota archaeon]
VVAQLLNSIAMGAVLLLISLYFQLVLDLSPFDAGIRIIPIDISFLILGPISGRLSDKFGHLPFTTSGLALTSLSLYLLSTADAFTPYLDFAVYMLLFGAGLGMFSSPNMSSIMGSVPPHRRGIASAISAIFFNMGFTISFNLAIFIMTLTVPYRIVTLLISSTNIVSIPEADKLLFVGGLKNTYFWLAILNAIAIIPSTLRGRRKANSYLT